MKRSPPHQTSSQAQISDRRLGFVFFALVLLILVPAFTSTLLDRGGQLNPTLRTIQFALSITLGVLGLLACWYIHHTHSLLRRNFMELDAQQRRLEGLFETASHLSVGAPEAMHGFLVQRAASILGAAGADLWGFDAERSVLTPISAAPAGDAAPATTREVPVRAGSGLARLLLEEHAPDRPAAAGGETDRDLEEIALGRPIDSLLAAPLVAHGQLVGLLCAYARADGPRFGADDARLLSIFAGQAAFVLHSANLYARSVARGEQMTALANVSASLSTSLDLSEALIVFVREGRGVIPFDTVSIALLPAGPSDAGWSVAEEKFDPELDAAAEASAETSLTRRIRGHDRWTHHHVAATGRADQGLESPARANAEQFDVWSVRKDEMVRHEARFRRSEDPLERAMAAGRSLLFSGARAGLDGQQESPPSGAADSPRSRDVHAELESGRAGASARESGLPGAAEPSEGKLIVVPLWGHDAIFGALQLESDGSAAFTRTHLVLARQLAGQVATVLQNARLVQEARRRADQLQWGMQETHHRIKNNLQAVSAILDLHLMEAGETVPADALRQALQQVRSIAAVHGLQNEDLQSGAIPMRKLLDTLAPGFVSGPGAFGKRIDLRIDAGDDRLPSRIASSVALTVNELVANAIVHGGRDRDEVRVDLVMRRECGRLCLVVRDDGPGFPQDYSSGSQNIGLTLVQMVIERDLGGSIRIENLCPGAEVAVMVPYAR